MNIETLNVLQLLYLILSIVCTVLLGIVGFYLRRDIQRGDKVEQDVKELKETKASKEEVKELSGCLSKVKEDYITKDDFNGFKDDTKTQIAGLSADMKNILGSYITKEDFYRVQGETSRKLDAIMDYLMKEKKG